ncbi:hypothetical protein Angca_009971, partial [Angiostrongylus cantonensis]
MIISEFSIHEVLASGEDLHLSCHEVRRLALSLRQIFADATTGLVALRMERSAKVICVLVTLLEMRLPFIFLREDEDPVSVGAKWLFNGKNVSAVFYLLHISVDITESNELCYFIRTSGTTGMEKLVGVPYCCIEPNIEDFRERFSISSEDVILCSTSFFFDPSIVEIFLSLRCASVLLLVPDKTRSHPHLLSAILRRYKPTFVQVRCHGCFKLCETRSLQLTPSVLALLDDVTLSWILGDCSPIRCLLIGGTRQCFINGVLSEKFTATGDVVEVIENEFFIIGRTDDQVKVNGTRCNLTELSTRVASLNGVSFAQFLLYKEKFLVLFVLSNSPLEALMRDVIPDAFIPSKVVYLDRVPVNSNGKADRSQMVALLEKQCTELMNSQSDMLLFLNKFGIKSALDLSGHSFVNFEIRHTVPFKEIFVTIGIQPIVKWAYNAGKCIDGPPLHIASLDKDVIVVSSHSGVVACIRVQDGYCIWNVNLSCRFEASPELCGQYIAVGGFDGNVYFLSVDTGYTEWLFVTGDIVKASCAVDDSNCAYVPSYDRNLYKLNPQLKKCCWRSAIQSGSPAKTVLWENIVFVTTICGSLEAMNAVDGMQLWLYRHEAPVFSSVTIHNSICFISSVDGTIAKLRWTDGKKQLTVSVQEPIFASVSVIGGLLYVVSQGGSLFIADQELSVLRRFRFLNCSFVVPASRISNYVLSLVSSNGLFILFSENESKAWSFRLGAGQVYSRVLICQEKQYLFAGCRDDWIRCFK